MPPWPSADGKTVAIGDQKVIHFYDTASGKETGQLQAHRSCLSLAYSPDGRLLASGGVDPGKDQNSIRIWDVAKGKELRRCELPKNEPPIDLAFCPKGDRLAAVIEEVDAHIFEVATGKPVQRLDQYWASRIAYAPDGKSLITVRGPTVRVWDAAAGKENFQKREGQRSGVRAVAVSSDGKLVASGGEDICLWDTATSKLIRRIAVKRPVAALAFAPDNKTLASAGRDKILHLWNVTTGQEEREFKGHKHPLCGVAFSPDGKLLASGDVRSTIRLWDVDAGKEVNHLEVKSLTDNLSLAFSPDSKTLAIGGAWDDSSFLLKRENIGIEGIEPKEGYFVLLLDASTGKEFRRFAGLMAKVKSVAFSPDGNTLAAAMPTAASDSGILLPVRKYFSLWPIRTMLSPTMAFHPVLALPFRPTARRWPPPAWTGPSGCGTRPRPGNSANSDPRTVGSTPSPSCRTAKRSSQAVRTPR